MTLTLSLEEINGILQSLGNMSYIQVESLIAKIRVQAQAQVELSRNGTPTDAVAEKV